MFAEELTMSQEAARLLYAGIVGDTGRFLYPATTSATLRYAADLLDYGFDAPKSIVRLIRFREQWLVFPAMSLKI